MIKPDPADDSREPDAILVGVDTGGTFTDFVVCSDAGVRTHKVLSRPEAPDEAIVAGLDQLGIADAPLVLNHGSTVATNAVLEGRGGRVVYVTNEGLADVLAIGRQHRRELYRLSVAPVPPPVPRDHCLEVAARLDARGQVIEPLTDAMIELLITQIEGLDPDAIAINLLFSFVDDAQERTLAAALESRWPVSRSSAVLPEIGEYERGIATWLNAYVAPRTARYLDALGQRLPQARISVMQSDGLMNTATGAARTGVRLLLSGPAGGLVGARRMAAASGYQRIMTLDVGGTSTDVALIDGDIQLTSEGRIGDYPVAVPMVDLHTVGAGGGSIAEVDPGGMLHVGPRSAGAQPGPACYGLGGQDPTLTDAFVAAGRLPDGAELGGGQVRIDRAAALAALAPLARRLDCDAQAAAEAIIRVVNEHMAGALRVISVQRGHDPRRFVLCAFGGAGGLHACELADALGMTLALVPAHAGVLSALGMAAGAPGRELTRSLLVALSPDQAPVIEEAFRDLESTLRDALDAAGVSGVEIERSADLRYQGQSFTLTRSWQDVDSACRDFAQAHRQRFGHALEAPVELVNLRVRGQGQAADVVGADVGTAMGYDSPGIVDRAALCDGVRRTGPLTVMAATGASWVAPGWTARLDDVGNLILERATG